MAAINFKKYHEDNPQIYEKFIHYARLTKAKGFKNYSSNGIFELIRWHTGVKGNDCFKLNNIYRPDYARKAMEEYPELDGFFRLRETKAKRV
jgi:hypothetical protein